MNLKSACASASYPWGMTLMACCRGALSTTDRFCAAHMAMGCASGVLGALKRQSEFLNGCCG